MNCYVENFITGHKVSLPEVKDKTQLATLIADPTKSVLEYQHFSCVVNKHRKLPFFSACNIDGTSTSDIERKGDFVTDTRISPDYQTAKGFYSVYGKFFDKGHMTKFTDVMWGTENEESLRSLGDSTFHYPNSVPQFNSLNRGMWSSLEKYILDTETDQLNLRVCLFTGPMLLPSDPVLKKTIDGKDYQLPLTFWKVVIYLFEKKLYGVGFVMSHRSMVEAARVLRPALKAVESMELVERARGEPAFMDYKHSHPYQVKVEFIEKMTGLKFLPENIVFPFQSDSPQELIFKEIDVIKTKKKEHLSEGEKKILEKFNISAKVRSQFTFSNMKLH